MSSLEIAGDDLEALLPVGNGGGDPNAEGDDDDSVDAMAAAAAAAGEDQEGQQLEEMLSAASSQYLSVAEVDGACAAVISCGGDDGTAGALESRSCSTTSLSSTAASTSSAASDASSCDDIAFASDSESDQEQQDEERESQIVAAAPTASGDNVQRAAPPPPSSSRGRRGRELARCRRQQQLGVLASMRRSGRRLLRPLARSFMWASLGVEDGVDAAPGLTDGDGDFTACCDNRDILSVTIRNQMWHLSDMILSNLDAVSLRTCEDVCTLWRQYIRREKIWKKVVQKSALASPLLARQNGWSQHVPALGGKPSDNVSVYRELYWKMTNLNELWTRKNSVERKNIVKRPGSIVWAFLPSGRTVSTYNSGRGFVLKIHDQMTCRFRHAQTVTLGTVKKDTLCMDASDKMVAVGGLVSQKVWVFTIKEGPPANKNALRSFWDAVNRAAKGNGGAANGDPPLEKRIYTDIFKFINAGSGVTAIRLHADGKRMAVLLPLNHKVEVWDIKDVMRLQSHDVPPDAHFLVWRAATLITATQFSGNIQVFDTEREARVASLSDSIRRIDALAVFRRLCATGEGRICRLWSLGGSGGAVEGRQQYVHPQPGLLAHFVATRTFISALAVNDALLATGSSSGIVKLWDLQNVLRKGGSAVKGGSGRGVAPLRRISMKGLLHYPIKMIDLYSYLDLVIVAKYEARNKKDKVKVVQVRT